MGYTHYFYSKLNKEQITSAMDDIEKIIQNGTDEDGYLEGGKIGNPASFDKKKEMPICDRKRGVINFNGDVNLEQGIDHYWNSELNHENLVVAPFTGRDDDDFNFCKTARKPYDKLVVATLFHLGYLFPDDFHWSSDGNLIEELEIDEDGDCLDSGVYVNLSDEFKEGFQLVWQTFHQESDSESIDEATIEKLLMPLEEFRQLEEDVRETVITRIIQEWIE